MKYCTKCGAKIAEDDNFCPVCGATQRANEPNESSTVYNPIVEETHEKVKDSDKSRTVAALLCFFLGGIGAHDFYVNKKAHGIMRIMILTFCLFAYFFALSAKVSLKSAYEHNLISLQELKLESELFSLPNQICSVAIGIWTLVDFILILLGNFKDFEGRPVTNWNSK